MNIGVLNLYVSGNNHYSILASQLMVHSYSWQRKQQPQL